MASELIAYCGLYCGTCSFKVTFDENGNMFIAHMPAYYDHIKNETLEFCSKCSLENKCGECAIRDCAMNNKIEYCSQCDDFPCDKLIELSSDRKPRRSLTMINLNLFKEIGEKCGYT